LDLLVAEGVRERQAETKALVVVIAVEERDTGIGRIRMSRISDAAASLESFIVGNIEPPFRSVATLAWGQ
jgi:hypothetical protein